MFFFFFSSVLRIFDCEDGTFRVANFKKREKIAFYTLFNFLCLALFKEILILAKKNVGGLASIKINVPLFFFFKFLFRGTYYEPTGQNK